MDQRRPVYTNQLIRAVGQALNSLVYSVGLTREIRVERAEKDAKAALCPVREQNSPMRGGKRQHIAEALAFPASREVSTSCPRRRNSRTTCSAMFSFA